MKLKIVGQRTRKIEKTDQIGEVISKYPNVKQKLLESGLDFESEVVMLDSLEKNMKDIDMSDSEIDKAINMLNETLDEEEFDVKNFKMEIMEPAVNKIKTLAKEGEGFKLSVKPGGCSGFSYDMRIGVKEEGEFVIEKDGAKVFIQKNSLSKLNRCKLTFIDSLQGAGFNVINPNASSTCGCGSSFS